MKKLTIAKQPTQRLIAVSFTLVSGICALVLGIILYSWSTDRMQAKTIEHSEQLLNQTAINIEVYLKNMRSISDAMYYDVIKDKDIAEESLEAEMNLIYETNKENLVNIACYTNYGELVAVAPETIQKSGVYPTSQRWFYQALDQMENLHFSTPHVAHLFEESGYQYHWVISLSRAVELTNDKATSLGVLLVDMNYSSIEQLFNKANENGDAGYIYLMDRNGEIIYHPKQQLIYGHLYNENNLDYIDQKDGSYQEKYNGENRLVTLKTVSYTGWKIVCVSQVSYFQFGAMQARYFFTIVFAVLALMIVLVNQLVSARIARPLQELNDSVKEWESGNMDADIYIGGSMEVAHLGSSLESAIKQLHYLMEQVVRDQEEKRKSELDALQSQINPHFLYNTLDSIVWMIEGEQYDSAVFMINQLASLFRISLSKGKTIIKIEDEITHVKNYMNIQKIRYKNKFEINYDIDEEIFHYCTVKLVMQPLLENAIYYGVESMFDEGRITVRGYKKESDIILEVQDNGLGMPQEVVDGLLKGHRPVRSKGSGVGLMNVHNRIRLRFGEQYGLAIHSVLDEGTCVSIRLPAIEYSEEHVELLENGKMIKMMKKQETEDEE